MYEDFTIILPTLNEEKTVPLLVKHIIKSYPRIKILVIDDDSTDNTEVEIKKISTRNKNIRFVKRGADKYSKGLTVSVADGIRLSRTKFVIVMDADFQHPPEMIDKIAKMLGSGCDIVVGNRATVGDWAFHRKMISRFYSYLGKFILFIERREGCKDVLSGFFGMKRSIFINIYDNNKDRFVCGGYKVLFDTLKCIKRGTVKICDFDYSFGERKYGSSKAGIKNGMLLFKSMLT